MNADFAHDSCRASDHVACAVCGGDVCLGFLSDDQRERALMRAHIDSEPIKHHDCAAQRRAA